jgi:hypothetical protein
MIEVDEMDGVLAAQMLLAECASVTLDLLMHTKPQDSGLYIIEYT